MRAENEYADLMKTIGSANELYSEMYTFEICTAGYHVAAQVYAER